MSKNRVWVEVVHRCEMCGDTHRGSTETFISTTSPESVSKLTLLPRGWGTFGRSTREGSDTMQLCPECNEGVRAAVDSAREARVTAKAAQP